MGFYGKCPGVPPFPPPGIPRGFCHKARGYAVPGVTPGMGGNYATTPKWVVPKDRTGVTIRLGVIMILGNRFGPKLHSFKGTRSHFAVVYCTPGGHERHNPSRGRERDVA